MSISNALVVDDSRLARLTLTKLLEKRQIDVEKVSSAQEAFETLKSLRPDIILMDVTMPDIDGLEATRMITNNPETSSIPIVMCTAEDSDEARAKAEACGATAFLTKPAGDENLDRVLAEIGQRLSAARTLEPAPQITPEQTPEPESAVAEANEAATAEFGDAARAALEALVEERLTTLAGNAARTAFDSHRADLEAAVVQAADSSARSVAEQAVRKAVEDVAVDIARQAAEDAVKAVATEVAQAETKNMGSTLSDALRAEVKSDMQSLLSGDAFTQRIQNIAGETAERSAADIAERTAREAARETAAELARSEAREAARAAAEEQIRSAGLEDAVAAASKAVTTARLAVVIAGAAIAVSVALSLLL